MKNYIKDVWNWMSGKTVVAGQQWSGTTYIDSYKRTRQPTPNELMAELKNTAWACASINAAVCASNPPQLYVATQKGQPNPKCLTKSLDTKKEDEIRTNVAIPTRFRKAMKIEQVIDHPLLTLFEKVNPVHNSFDLWELTTLYQEVHGITYWYIEFGPMDTPQHIWILPTQNVTPYRAINSPNIVDYYIYRNGRTEQRFTPDEIIAFKYPDPKDPYTSGLAPLRACYEQVALTSDYAAMKKAIYDNRGLPGVVISPEESMGDEERDSYEAQWNQKFRRGGAGKVLIAESKMKVDLITQSMGDIQQLAEIRATMEDICNAFHVPISYMTTNVNMANLQAAERQHMHNAIHPRLKRRDEKINEQMIPLYDPSGRLFVASEDPSPLDAEADNKRIDLEMKYGITTVNEVRSSKGLPPVPWGDAPWLPSGVAQPNQQRGTNDVQ